MNTSLCLAVSLNMFCVSLNLMASTELTTCMYQRCKTQVYAQPVVCKIFTSQTPPEFNTVAPKCGKKMSCSPFENHLWCALREEKIDPPVNTLSPERPSGRRASRYFCSRRLHVPLPGQRVIARMLTSWDTAPCLNNLPGYRVIGFHDVSTAKYQRPLLPIPGTGCWVASSC